MNEPTRFARDKFNTYNVTSFIFDRKNEETVRKLIALPSEDIFEVLSKHINVDSEEILEDIFRRTDSFYRYNKSIGKIK